MSQEFRRARRRKAHQPIAVTDAMTGEVIGQVGNLSESGMLLLASRPLVNDALYQFRFPLEAANGRAVPLEIGAHLLWSDEASAPGQHWIGFRFIGQDGLQRRQLRAWVNAPGSQYA